MRIYLFMSAVLRLKVYITHKTYYPLLLIVCSSITAFGQIKTPEIEVRVPSTSTLNEIEGETRIDGDLEIKSGAGAELNLLNTATDQKWQIVSGVNRGFEIGNVTDRMTDTNAPFFINAAGHVGINTADPYGVLHVRAGNSISPNWSPSTGTVAILESTHTSRAFLTMMATNYTDILFADKEDETAGRIRYLHGVDRMDLWTNGARRVTIDNPVV